MVRSIDWMLDAEVAFSIIAVSSSIGRLGRHHSQVAHLRELVAQGARADAQESCGRLAAARASNGV
jgi:hypothetical protein